MAHENQKVTNAPRSRKTEMPLKVV